jgi:hypothetical protein
MNIVIATGCHHSGWEMILPILQQAGLTPVGDSFVLWHDEVFQAAGITEPLSLDQPLRPEPAMAESAARLLPQDSAAPSLIADSRSLWLLDFWAEQTPKAQFLLFYTRPEAAIAHALLQGIEPQQALQGWQTASRQMLQFQRRHRRSALLLDAEAAGKNLETLIEICRRAGIPLQSPPGCCTPGSGPVSVERLLAGMLAEAQPAVQHLQAELEASAHPLGDSLSVAQLQPLELLHDLLTRQVSARNLQQLLDEVGEKLHAAQNEQNTRQQDHQALTGTHSEIVKENELLLLQLHQVQEELETIFLNKEKIELEQKEKDQQLTQLRKQVSQLTRDRDEQARLATERQSALEQIQQTYKGLTAKQAEAEQENELLLLQLHQVQEELETIFLQKQQLEQAHRGIEKELGSRSSDLRQVLTVNDKEQPPAKLQQSGSWKMPASVRGILNPFKGSKSEKARIRKQILLVKSSGLFDEKWYLDEYPDVAAGGTDPVEHYLRFGAAEERDPSAQFSTQFYLRNNPDVAADGVNPLVHYIKFGKAEGRLTSSHSGHWSVA